MRNLLCIGLIAFLVSIGIADDQLVITGSTTVLPIAQACAEEYMDEHENADITVRGGGSGVGFAALIDGQCDIANASREIKEEEIETAQEKGVEPVDNKVAFDAIAVIVHPDNPVKGLTLEQLRDIYTGRKCNWKEFGGPDKSIVIVSRDVSSGTYEVFKEKVLEGETVDDGALKVASNQAAGTTVSSTPYGIAYIGLGYLNSRVKAIDIEGIPVGMETARDESYPIVRALHMYTDGEPAGIAKAYIDFILCTRGQEIVAELGYIPVK